MWPFSSFVVPAPGMGVYMKMIKGGTVVQFRQQVNLLLFLVIAFALNGCATTKAVVYVKEAEQVTTQALEPVMLESEELRNDISTKFSSYLPSADTADDLMKIIQTELANTKRFTKVLLNASEGDTYILQPRIELQRPIVAVVTLAVEHVVEHAHRLRQIVQRLDPQAANRWLVKTHAWGEWGHAKISVKQRLLLPRPGADPLHDRAGMP